MLSPVDFISDTVESPDDVIDENDNREDKTKRGSLINCHYCGDTLRIDLPYEGFEDYPPTQPEEHCESCSSHATYNLCM